MRDEAYDQFQSPNGDAKVVDIVRKFHEFIKQEKLKQNNEIGYYLYLLGSFSTTTAMRLARKL